MARVTKCDRCGKIFDYSVSHIPHVVQYVGGPDVVLSAPALDLCDECFDELLEFLKPIRRTEEKGNE